MNTGTFICFLCAFTSLLCVNILQLRDADRIKALQIRVQQLEAKLK